MSRLLRASKGLRAQSDSDRESVVDSSGMKGGGLCLRAIEVFRQGSNKLRKGLGDDNQGRRKFSTGTVAQRRI
jgi:hypothetical protein